MKFRIGYYYQHSTGPVIHILGEVQTFFWGSGLLAEEDGGHLKVVGSDEESAKNWHVVSGWSRSCYKANGIPDPQEPKAPDTNGQ